MHEYKVDGEQAKQIITREFGWNPDRFKENSNIQIINNEISGLESSSYLFASFVPNLPFPEIS